MGEAEATGEKRRNLVVETDGGWSREGEGWSEERTWGRPPGPKATEILLM